MCYIYEKETCDKASDNVLNSINIFIKNEEHIIWLNKYNYMDNKYRWLPYTEEFFKFYK